MYKLTGFLFFTYMTFKNPMKHRIVRNFLIAKPCRLRFSFLSFQITEAVFEAPLKLSLEPRGALSNCLRCLYAPYVQNSQALFLNFSYNF